MRLKDITLTINEERLNTINKEVLEHLTAAADEMGNIFLKQNYSKNEEIATALKKRGDQELLARFYQQAGPFDRTNHNKPFIEGHKKPAGAGFYPDDMTKEEWNTYIKEHPDEKKLLEDPYTIIKREKKKLIATPYHEAYKEHITKAAKHLRGAAKKSKNESLKAFLKARATAMETDEYYDSELLWMDLDGDIEITIGPYEVYEDEINGYKTAYEAFIGLVDQKATEEVAHLEEQTAMLEEHLPLSDDHKNTNRGTQSPIKIVDEIYSAGDCKAGVHFTAFNLPNDEKVREAKGSKKVMIKNVAEAKYEHCWTPIVEKTFTPRVQERVNFDAYFLHVLLHEISHGIGPGTITKDGEKTTVSAELKETYPTIEEAKADLLAIHNAFVLAEKEIITEKEAWGVLHSFIAGTFRSIRFGINEAHGGANSIALNWLFKQGAVVWQIERIGIKQEQAKEALGRLVEKILIIQAKGNYEAAKELIQQYRPLGSKVTEAIERLKNIPIDINPKAPLEK